MSALEHELCRRFGARFIARRPLADLTSFRIGGPADYFVQVESEQELCDAMRAASGAGTPVFCLGAGTNLLVSDRGVRGMVVHLGESFERIEIEATSIVAGAAAQFRTLVAAAVARGLAGLEFGEGIPGSVGGGLVMNAGAFGGEIARVVRLVHGVSREGELLALTHNDVKFAYRRTDLPRGFIITRVDFALERGDCAILSARVAELKARRAARQPKDEPNAGSIFKNPPGNFAGRLLEGAGMKGLRLGGAAFSERHANFIVNRGGARADEVRELIEMARKRVNEASGIWLEPEVKLVGDW